MSWAPGRIEPSAVGENVLAHLVIEVQMVVSVLGRGLRLSAAFAVMSTQCVDGRQGERHEPPGLHGSPIRRACFGRAIHCHPVEPRLSGDSLLGAERGTPPCGAHPIRN